MSDFDHPKETESDKSTDDAKSPGKGARRVSKRRRGVSKKAKTEESGPSKKKGVKSRSSSKRSKKLDLKAPAVVPLFGGVKPPKKFGLKKKAEEAEQSSEESETAILEIDTTLDPKSSGVVGKRRKKRPKSLSKKKETTEIISEPSSSQEAPSEDVPAEEDTHRSELVVEVVEEEPNPEPAAVEPEVEVVEEALGPEPAAEEPEVEAVEEALGPEPVAEEATAEVVEETPQPEPVAEEPAMEVSETPSKPETVVKEAPDPVNLSPRDQETVKVDSAKVMALTSQRLNAELKQLEKELNKSAPKQPLPSFQKRAVASIRFLSTLAGTQRAMVLIEDGKQEFEVSAVGGMDDDLYKTQTSLRLLKFVYLNRDPLMLIDAQKDLRFGRDTVVRKREIRSLICVPFQDAVSGVRGLLYADNVSQPNVFTYQELRRVEAFAKKLATEESLGEFEARPPEPPPQLQTEVEPTSPWVYVGLCLVVLILAVPTLVKGKETPKPTETPSVVRRQIAQADAVLIGFLRSLESRSLRGSYEFLSPLKKKEVDFETFERKWSEYLAVPENLWTVGHLKIEPSSSTNENLKQFLLQPEGDEEPWKATLHKEDDVWYLQDLEGPIDL